VFFVLSLCYQAGWETADGGEIYVLCAFNQDKAMKLPHQAGWETADLGEIAVLCALNQDTNSCHIPNF
jgi:hypothetical protein